MENGTRKSILDRIQYIFLSALFYLGKLLGIQLFWNQLKKTENKNFILNNPKIF